MGRKETIGRAGREVIPLLVSERNKRPDVRQGACMSAISSVFENFVYSFFRQAIFLRQLVYRVPRQTCGQNFPVPCPVFFLCLRIRTPRKPVVSLARNIEIRSVYILLYRIQ